MSSPTIKVIDLKELLKDAKEIHLIHGDAVYRLRLTKANKLILTK